MRVWSFDFCVCTIIIRLTIPCESCVSLDSARRVCVCVCVCVCVWGGGVGSLGYLWLWGVTSHLLVGALSVDLGRRGAAGQERPKALRRPVPRQSFEAMPALAALQASPWAGARCEPA